MIRSLGLQDSKDGVKLRYEPGTSGAKMFTGAAKMPGIHPWKSTPAAGAEVSLAGTAEHPTAKAKATQRKILTFLSSSSFAQPP